MSANGQLTDAELSLAAGCVVGSFQGSGQLANAAAAAWNAFNAECVREAGAHLTDNGPSSAYRNYAMQQYFWNLYVSGQGNLAAHPGTSNHGWGLATDTPPYVWALMRARGGKYGWGPCSDAPSEAWHRRWCGNWHGSDPGGGSSQPRYPTLKRGAHGGAVKRLQKHLRRWNQGMTQPGVDGDFGKRTDKAVRQFQAVRGLHVDGVVGKKTWARLRLKDHFLEDERHRLNNLLLIGWHQRRRKDHNVTKEEAAVRRHARAWAAKRAHSIKRVAATHGWKGNHRRVRFDRLRHAAGSRF